MEKRQLPHSSGYEVNLKTTDDPTVVLLDENGVREATPPSADSRRAESERKAVTFAGLGGTFVAIAQLLSALHEGEKRNETLQQTLISPNPIVARQNPNTHAETSSIESGVCYPYFKDNSCEGTVTATNGKVECCLRRN